jgi:hypothetical protein
MNRQAALQGSRIFNNPSTASLSANFSALADPETKQIDAAILDFLNIELVATLRRSSKVAQDKRKEREDLLVASGLLSAPSQVSPLVTKREAVRDSMSAARSTKTLEEEDEALRHRLEAIGMHVGAGLTERLCKDRFRFADTLDMVKFICKDIWGTLWDKQVDNLRTNHRGVYVLQDNAFKPLLRVSSPYGSSDSLKQARLFLAYPAGIIRGALLRLGLQGTVLPETTSLPQCTFQVKLPRS